MPALQKPARCSIATQMRVALLEPEWQIRFICAGKLLAESVAELAPCLLCSKRLR